MSEKEGVGEKKIGVYERKEGKEGRMKKGRKEGRKEGRKGEHVHRCACKMTAGMPAGRAMAKKAMIRI